MTTIRVGHVSEFPVGHSKEVAGVLVCNTKEHGLTAIGAKCTHYNAPLSAGVLSGDRVVCPWHGACFHVATGDIEDAPALRPLDTYTVSVSDSGDVHVSTNPNPKARATASGVACGGPGVAVIGGGAGGDAAVEELRASGYAGSITVFSKESCLPYDRPKLSKAPGVSVESIALRSAGFYESMGVTFKLGTEVTDFDASTRTVVTSSGDSLQFEHVILCTGARSFNIPVPGHDFSNILTLRSGEDASAIHQALVGVQNVVIIGTGFIGLELATYIGKNLDASRISCISMDEAPLQAALGVEVGKLVGEMYVTSPVELHQNHKLSRYESDDSGKVISVVAINAKGNEVVFPADVVIVGAGSRLNTGFIRNLAMNDPEKSIIVDSTMKSSADRVYAVGDIARFPYRGGALTRIEHWSVSQNQARVAARSIAGRKSTFDTTPFFWSVQFSGNLRYVGHAAQGYDSVIVQSNSPKFAGFYVKDGEVVAVATFGMDPLASQCAELIRLNAMPSPKEIQEQTVAWDALILQSS